MKKYEGREPVLIRKLEKKYAPPWYDETLEETAPPPKKPLGKPAGLRTPPPSPLRLADAATPPPPPPLAEPSRPPDVLGHLRYLLNPLAAAPRATGAAVDLLSAENPAAAGDAPPDLFDPFGGRPPPVPDPAEPFGLPAPEPSGSAYVDPFADAPSILD